MLYDDLDSVDLKAKVTSAWKDFTLALSRALPTLPADARLDLTLDPTAAGTGPAVYEIHVVTGAEGELFGYAVGNANLPDGYHLGRSAVADMIELGWSPPGMIDGSPGDFGVNAEAGESQKLAALLSRTMRDVYGAPHPAFLTYTVRPVSEPSARPAAIEAAPEAEAPKVANADLPLVEKVRTVVAALLKTEADKLQIDDEGEISIRSGSAMVFVKVHDNPAMVDVYSPILTEVQADQKLHERLAQLTRRMPIGRLYCVEGTVWASVPVIGRDFQPTHLMLAVQVMTGLADELDDRLHGEFGGKRFFGEGDSPRRPTGEERTGFYL